MVRVGGGYQKIEEYIAMHQEEEMKRLRRIIAESGKSMNEVIIDLISKYGAEQSVINKV